MRELLIRKIGREKMKDWYYSIICLMNSKYRKALNKAKGNFRFLPEEKLQTLKQNLITRYQSEVLDDVEQQDLEDHIVNRLSGFRHRTIPWLNSIKPLSRCKVLEIGCGTGCTTIALAEQGCTVTSIDLDEKSIAIAQKRCELYGLTAQISVLNATQINKIGEKFDIIVFPDSLEHMTYDERILSLRLAWNMLSVNALLVVVGTPNRLYFFDRHSSLLPFYNWLPDKIAMQYAKHSPRQVCVDSCKDELELLRFGRGVSYHEFELALGINCANLTVFDMWSFLKAFLFTRIVHRTEYDYIKFLRSLGPSGLPKGFFCEQLHIAIRKHEV